MAGDIYRHYKGGRYRVLFEARVSTNGPDEGRLVVVYVSLTTGAILVRDRTEFHIKFSDLGIPRFELED